MNILAVDPGISHLVAVIFKCDEMGNDISVAWTSIFNVQHEILAISKAAEVMAKVSEKLGVERALVEFQAPMGNKNTCRWNAYVEGAVSACLCSMGLRVETVHPSAAKRNLKLATGNYQHNKQIAFNYASSKCKTLKNHHEADCFILTEFWLKNKNGNQ